MSIGNVLGSFSGPSRDHSATGHCTLAPDRPCADVGICRACLEQGLFDELVNRADNKTLCQAEGTNRDE